MDLEEKLARYIAETRFEDLPKEPVATAKNVVLTIVGNIIAGATVEGCEVLVDQVKEWGGKGEATILIHGGQAPAHNAAFVNSAMAHALDFDDGMLPGIHVGASAVPTALATAELVGGCNGKDFLAAIVLGTEVAARINFASDYDGFDPTGVCSIFATAAISGKILGLNPEQMLNALALAFNRSGGSWQSNIDGSLAVMVIQGFVSQGGIICAQLAQRGVTGPKNFLEGIYGYFHLYAKDKFNPQVVAEELGERFYMTETLFKKYPSCGSTLGSTEAILELVRENGLTSEDVAKIDIKVTPHCYNLCGHPFEIRDNPRTDAQFNIQYCVANALLRKRPKLSDFEPSSVRDPKIMELTKKIHVVADPALFQGRPEFLCRTDIKVTTTRGTIYHKIVAVPRGFPKNPLTSEEHMQNFKDCVSYGGKPLPRGNIEAITSLVSELERVEDVRSLNPLLLSENQ